MNIEDYDSDHYDKDAMEIDAKYGNMGDPEEYRHENIVFTSLMNGQFEQAQGQCADYGLGYECQLRKFRAQMQKLSRV